MMKNNDEYTMHMSEFFSIYNYCSIVDCRTGSLVND